MRTIVRFKWAVMAVWIAAIAALLLTAPNLGTLVHEKGQITIPEGYSSDIAAKLLDQAAKRDGAKPSLSLVLVLHDAQGRADQLQADGLQAVEKLRTMQDQVGLTSVVSFAEQPELAAKLISADGKTLLIPFHVERGELSVVDIRDRVKEQMKTLDSEAVLTGSGLIEEDVVINSQEGLKRTEYITVIIILVILLAVFRSAVAPLIPLFTIGMSYLAAQSVVAFLADRWDFPLSTFTQIFMVAVMFGIGTDYCILLISRFKEELGSGRSKVDAIVTTYKTAGKTVLYAGIAVMAGFASIGFSKFSLFQSAVSVAVGILVLMIALLTVVPFFMALLGKGLFWPASRKMDHPDSRIWGFAGKFTMKRPLITAAVLAAVIIPTLLAYNGSLSYNSMDEIGDQYDSVRGFNLIADSFGPGETMPATIVIQADRPLADPDSMAAIEALSAEVAGADGVAYVRSVTRPMGAPMEQPQVDPAMLTPEQQAAMQAAQQMVMATYMSSDMTLTKIEVILDTHPYAAETLDHVDGIKTLVETSIHGTPLDGAQYGIGGVSSLHDDLRNVSADDYNRTLVLMLAAIAILLFVLLRSVIMPIYLIASLLLTYYMTMTITELVFMNGLGYDGLSWAVPFFAFVILIALGVDYSIFLMGRFNENRDMKPAEAIISAMRSMGTVIFSAAIILSGTFAAMLPSGVLSLLQIATIVIVGLILYCAVFLPFFVPLMVRLFGRFNRLPFMKRS
jgi:uncharacterized membrane protein YdfJ with MMPL/SSD domain